MVRHYIIIFLSVKLLAWLVSSVDAQAIIDFETGAVFNGYNDVRIPGDDGTLFSLTDYNPKQPFSIV